MIRGIGLGVGGGGGGEKLAIQILKNFLSSSRVGCGCLYVRLCRPDEQFLILPNVICCASQQESAEQKISWCS